MAKKSRRAFYLSNVRIRERFSLERRDISIDRSIDPNTVDSQVKKRRMGWEIKGDEKENFSKLAR